MIRFRHHLFVGLLGCGSAIIATGAGADPMPAWPTDLAAAAATSEPLHLFADDKVRFIFRCDDIGFCHAANAAFEQVAREGVVTAVSVIVNTPWLDEAVEIVKRHPEISVGVHTCLNCEWTPYRWGPVLPPAAVPTLVDEWGHFFGTRKQLLENNPNLDEVERELRAQVDLALKKGLKLSYLDHHMSGAVSTPAMRERFERVARDYGLAMSRYFGERPGPVWYRVPPAQKPKFLAEGVGSYQKPGLYLVVCHPGLMQPEMQVLRDLNVQIRKDDNTTLGLEQMAAHRQAETDGLCHPDLRRVIQERGIELIGYDALRSRYLDKMRRPTE